VANMKQCIDAAKILVRRIAQDLQSIEGDISGRNGAPLFTLLQRLAAEDEHEEKVINGSCEQLGIASGGPPGPRNRGSNRERGPPPALR
jgi:hypothetical protein